jgi:ankyrin repeat protein
MTRKQPKRNSRAGVDDEGRTALHHAAMDGHAETVARLLADGADPSVPDDDGWTPLHAAAAAHHADVCVALLAAGATVDPVDGFGNTPLWRATFESRGRGEVITLLRRQGADPTRANASGVSPLKLAHTIANYDVRQYFDDLTPS